jgi:hypothetical protein
MFDMLLITFEFTHSNASGSQPIDIFKGVVFISHHAKLRPQISLKAQNSNFSKSSNLLESQTPYLNANF